MRSDGTSDSAAPLQGDSKFRLMFERSADAVLLLDTGTNLFVEYNQATLDMLRCTRGELSALHPSALSPAQQPDGQDSFAKANAMIAKAIRDGSHRFEWVHRSPHRAEFPVEVLLTTLSLGDAPMLMVVWRDITERKRETAALQQSQRLESLGVMAGGIAHDFNNVLSGISGHVELARLSIADPERALAHLDTVRLGIARAADLTRKMLAYSGAGQRVTEAIDLGSMVREMIELLRASASGRAAVLCELPASAPCVEADRAQLQQVIMNLFTNATEAIGDGGGKIVIRVGQAALDEETLKRDFAGQGLSPGTFVTLEVEDTGYGMSPEVLARIFDPFYSTKQPGRGLGLSALLGILKAHRAGIRIASEVGVGTTFHVCFPASTRVPAKASPPSSTVRARGDGTVLMVDDDRNVRSSLGALLATLGFSVLEAKGGREAIEVFRQNWQRVGWVLMDLTMPDLDGLAAVRALREIDPNVIVVVSSGWAPADVVARFAEAPPAALLPKPFSYEELQATLLRVGILRVAPEPTPP